MMTPDSKVIVFLQMGGITYQEKPFYKGPGATNAKLVPSLNRVERFIHRVIGDCCGAQAGADFKSL
jgi:hypothetical protein